MSAGPIDYSEPIPTIGDVLEAVEAEEAEVEAWQSDPCTHTDNPNRCREIGHKAYEDEVLAAHLSSHF